MVTYLLTSLMIFMILGALKALQTKNLLSAVISLGAVGFGVSIVYMVLGAPDAAIPHIVVEIMALLLLIRATLWRGIRTVSGQRDIFGSSVAAILVLLLLVLLVPIFNQIPFDTPANWAVGNSGFDLASRHYLQAGLKETGAANIVAAVILAYRGYDTLGEATVLFTAVIGALVLLREEPRTGKGMEDRK